MCSSKLNFQVQFLRNNHLICVVKSSHRIPNYDWFFFILTAICRISTPLEIVPVLTHNFWLINILLFLITCLRYYRYHLCRNRTVAWSLQNKSIYGPGYCISKKCDCSSHCLKMNLKAYIRILESQILAYDCFQDEKTPFSTKDKASCHPPKATKKWFNGYNIPLFRRPSQLHDLNILNLMKGNAEHFYANDKQYLYKTDLK